MDVIELNKNKLRAIGGLAAADMYMNNDISFNSLSAALLAGISLDEIQKVINVNTTNLNNDQKVEILMLFKNIGKIERLQHEQN